MVIKYVCDGCSDDIINESNKKDYNKANDEIRKFFPQVINGADVMLCDSCNEKTMGIIRKYDKKANQINKELRGGFEREMSELFAHNLI